MAKQSKEGQAAKEAKAAEHQGFSRRLVVMTFVFCVLFSGLGYRAFDLQVRRSAAFRQMVEISQYLTLRLPAKRGEIFDRNMNPLGISVEVDSLYANPRLVGRKAQLAKKLSPVIDVPRRKLLGWLLQDRYFVWLKRHVSRRQMRAIRRLGLGQSVRVVQERKRFYPNRQLASHILGYTDRDGRGLAGVERFFDRLLRGKKRSIRLPHDPKGRHILHPKKLSFSGQTGASVVLTIDKTIQYITESALAEAVTKHKAKKGTAIVMDPRNGDVLALAIAPTFDPNKFRKAPVRLRNNSALSNPYEPGSTMKVISLAIARHLNVFRKNEVLDCENGRMRIGRYTIRDDHPHKRLTATGTMQYSSNICTAKLAMRVGKYRLYKYMRMFGFGEKTNIGLPWESKGILHKPKRWANISLANIAFGQGVSVTPLQLTSAISAAINGGVYYKPRLYKSIVDSKGRVIRKLPPRRVRRVISRAASRDVIRMTEAVVKDGTGKNAQIEGIRIGGKTGTAQKPRANGRGYGKGRIGSFVGFLPAENPRLVILVVIDEPQGSKYGGVVAAPAWRKIALASMQHLGYMSGGKLEFQHLKPPPLAAQAPADDKGNAPKAGKQNKKKSKKKNKQKQAKKKAKKKAKAKKRAKRPKMPNFLGLSVAAAKNLAQQHGLRLNPIGNGSARYQKPSAGVTLSSRRITVIFTSSN